MQQRIPSFKIMLSVRWEVNGLILLGLDPTDSTITTDLNYGKLDRQITEIKKKRPQIDVYFERLTQIQVLFEYDYRSSN